MLDLFSTIKEYKDQTSTEKIYLLKLIAQKLLGAKWEYYRKIKHAGESFKLIKRMDLMEQMKATQAALRFTSKHTKKIYRATYKNSLNDIKRFSVFRNDDFPELKDSTSSKDPEGILPEHDEVIITWTPLKFILSSKTIREKGIATQPHSEGLVAKLYFKLIGFYAVPENWDREKLTIYTRKLNEDSTYQDVFGALSPLKDDLLRFSDMYVPFKFGKASISREKTADDGVFDEDLGESFEDQIKTLYWYNFIYWGIERFLIKYYLTLVSTTTSKIAIRFISGIFKPAIQKAIENRIIFEASFETDISKRKFRRPYIEYCKKREKDPLKKKIKTKKGIFEIYSYNLEFLRNQKFDYEFDDTIDEKSGWGNFVDYELLDGISFVVQKGGIKKEPLPHKVIKYALSHILSTLICCTQYKRKSKYRTLELFQHRVESDKELTEKRIEKIRSLSERQIRQMERKVTKLRRMKQKDTAAVYQRDIELYIDKVEEKCRNIIDNSKFELQMQKRRIKKMYQTISRDKDISEGASAKNLLDLIVEVSPKRDFLRDYTRQVAEDIQADYDTELEPFYENMFHILKPSIQEKVILIQSLEKTGKDKSVKLSLNDEELQQNENIINLLKLKIKKGMPDIFNCRVIQATTLIPLNDLFKLSIDNESLQTLLKLKVLSKKSSKPFILKESIIKILLVLNLVSNPVPKNRLLNENEDYLGEQNLTLNTVLLNQLLSDLQKEKPNN